MEKTEDPTSTRLEELREKGIVTYSAFAARSAGALVVLISLLALRGRAQELLDGMRALVIENNPRSILSGGMQTKLFSELFLILLAPALAALLGTFLAGLFQTRFLFRFGQASPSMARLNPFSVNSVGTVFYEIGLRVLAVFLSVLFAAVFLRLVVSDILGLANGSLLDLLPWLSHVVEAALPLFVPVLAFCGFLSWLFARQRFMRVHRMTREEVMRESRDN